ncbi:MAG: FprA family A-type flavoprotein [Candidatus Omnitrophica bacterium]|nr:FprA family A-type flavoprotein [Candidatus Omnitrophota bacterium]MCM8816342.1 FprA family A-type flavoprotein [Candidatus Omnitrophota bacterium]
MEIVKDVYCIKTVDWDLKTFHGYSTPYGTTYNAYLCKGEENILIDTAKYYCEEQFFKMLESIVPIKKISYVISNHAELDHSGLIVKLLERSGATLICSQKGKENLERHFHREFSKIIVVQDKQTLKIGNISLQFFLTPMVHWPDSMVTYLPDKKLLFSNDAFGQHIASTKFFVDEVGLDIVLREARKYYANIVNPYASSVKKVLSSLDSLDIQMILPSHGLIWRDRVQIETIVEKYSKWAGNEAGQKILIVYATMWGSTKKMAERCYLEAVEKKYEAEMMNLSIKHISDIVGEIPEAKILVFGTSVLHNQILPEMAGLITYLSGLKFIGRKAWTFGSYGWAEFPLRKFEAMLKEAGFEVPHTGFYIKFVPEQQQLVELGKFFREKILD